MEIYLFSNKVIPFTVSVPVQSLLGPGGREERSCKPGAIYMKLGRRALRRKSRRNLKIPNLSRVSSSTRPDSSLILNIAETLKTNLE